MIVIVIEWRLIYDRQSTEGGNKTLITRINYIDKCVNKPPSSPSAIARMTSRHHRHSLNKINNKNKTKTTIKHILY